MYIRAKTPEGIEVTIMVGSIAAIESREDGTSNIFMLNGHTYHVINTQRMVRTGLRKSAKLTNATGQETYSEAEGEETNTENVSSAPSPAS